MVTMQRPLLVQLRFLPSADPSKAIPSKAKCTFKVNRMSEQSMEKPTGQHDLASAQQHDFASRKPEKPRLRMRICPQLTGFSSHMGPFYELRLPSGQHRRALELDARHGNPEGVVHGGVLSAFGDFVLYRCIGDELGHELRFATIQLNLQYLASTKPGRWLYGEGLVLRKTRDLIFASGELFTDERSIASVSGIWKVLSQA
jgi:acyl-coenzyme A thioesterase PaaI-like protein